MERKRKVAEKTDDTEYAVVLKKLGNARFLVRLNLQKKEVIAKVRGSMRQKKARKSNFVEVDSVVLVGIREFEDKNVDIIRVFTPEEVKALVKNGTIVTESAEQEDGNADGIEFFDFETI